MRAVGPDSVNAHAALLLGSFTNSEREREGRAHSRQGWKVCMRERENHLDIGCLWGQGAPYWVWLSLQGTFHNICQETWITAALRPSSLLIIHPSCWVTAPNISQC